MVEDDGKAQQGDEKEWLKYLAMSAFIFVSYIFPVPVVICLIYWSYTSTFGCVCVVCYMAWLYCDRNIHEQGGRRWSYFRDLRWWHYHMLYNPVTVHKTADLPPEKSYLLALVPHGVLSMGAISAFATNAHKLSRIYPGISFYLCTLKVLFYLPIIRELYLMGGLVSTTRRCLDHLLSRKGSAPVVIVGGAAEAAYSQPGEYKTLINTRKGFCRVALQNGASLVPVVAFGEVEIYSLASPEPGSLAHRIQHWIKSTTGVLPVIMRGDGFLGLLPRRKPIHVVVGAPITVEKNSGATREEVDKLHEEFITRLTVLFEENKSFYLPEKECHLQFI